MQTNSVAVFAKNTLSGAEKGLFYLQISKRKRNKTDFSRSSLLSESHHKSVPDNAYIKILV